MCLQHSTVCVICGFFMCAVRIAVLSSNGAMASYRTTQFHTSSCISLQSHVEISRLQIRPVLSDTDISFSAENKQNK